MPIRTDRDIRWRYRSLLAAVAVAALWIGDLRSQPAADLLLVGGFVYDGSGQPPGRQDVGVVGERISFVGDAAAAGLDAAVVVDVDGLLVTPGFIDMHSHAELTEDYGRDALPFLHQGITTVAIGVDGGGTPDVAELFAGLDGRIGANTFAYVGHGEIRERVIGEVDRAPTAVELNEMRALVRQAMNEGAFGLSTGLFYVPGYFATIRATMKQRYRFTFRTCGASNGSRRCAPGPSMSERASTSAPQSGHVAGSGSRTSTANGVR